MRPPIFTPISLQESPVILTAIGQVKIISVCVRLGSWVFFSANFAPHALLTLAPHSSYALNLKPSIKVSKVSWKSQFLYKILRSSLERKFDKTNFISPKRTPPKSLHLLGLKSVDFKKTVAQSSFQSNLCYFSMQQQHNKYSVLSIKRTGCNKRTGWRKNFI